MFQTSRATLVASMAVMLSQIAIGTPGSVRNLMAIAGVTPSESAWPTGKRNGGTITRTTKRRRGKKLHHRQKR